MIVFFTFYHHISLPKISSAERNEVVLLGSDYLVDTFLDVQSIVSSLQGFFTPIHFHQLFEDLIRIEVELADDVNAVVELAFSEAEELAGAVRVDVS